MRFFAAARCSPSEFDSSHSGQRRRKALAGRYLAALIYLFLTATIVAAQVTATNPIRPSRSQQFHISTLQDAEVDGTLEIVNEDLVGSHRLRYFLNGPDQRLELHFVGDPPDGLITGQKLATSGKVVPPDMYLLPSAVQILPDGFNSTQLAGLSSPNTFGNQPTIVLLVNFQDDTSKPFNTSDVQDVVFNQTDAFYREASQGQTWVTGKVYENWVTVPMTSKKCDFFDLANLADQIATSAGVNLTPYSHVIYAFRSTACDFVAASYLNGKRIWVNDAMRVAVIGHEMGHNLGLYHSHGLLCSGTSTGSNCTKDEYGDIFDIMGDTLAAHFNAFQKERLGYLNYGSSLPITTVTASGTYDISPYEYFIPNVAPSKALKIVTDLDPTKGKNDLFYVEYRQLLGFDASLQDYPGAFQGVLIHQASSLRPDTSFLVDAHPNTPGFEDADLLQGEKFTDAASGISIELLNADSNGAEVKVTYSQDACAYMPPSVTMSPPSYSVAPGTTVTYTATVKNTNGPTCSESTYDLTNSVPAGFTANLDKSTITLPTGASGQATLTMASPADSASGNSRFYVVAKDEASGYSGAGAASYIVMAPFSLTASQSTVTVAQGGSAAISVTSTVNPPFSSAVSLSITGVPSGVMTGFSPSGFLAPGSGKSTLSFLVAPSATPGTYPLTIVGTGGGLTQQIALTLNINASGNFALTLTPAAVSVVKGGSNTLIVTSNIFGSFSSNVALSISGLPASVTAEFSPASIAAPGMGNSTLTLYADNTASVGSTYMVVVSGLGAGLTRTATLSITIAGLQPPPPPPGQVIPIPQSGYNLVYADSSEQQCGIHAPTAAFDGNPNSFWESQNCLATVPLPHELQIDLGATYNIAGFKYLPRQDGQPTGKVRNFQFFVSDSTQNWGSPVISGTLITASSDVSDKQVFFSNPVSGRYIRFVATSEVNGGQITTVAELTALQTTTAPANDFKLAASPSTVNVVRGSNGTTTITSTLIGSFSSAVNLSASGLPPGATATFNPTAIAAPGSGSSTLTLTTTGVTVGLYPITITGKAGAVTHTTTLNLNVTSSNPGLQPIPQSAWKLQYVDSQETQCGLFLGQYAFDGNPGTLWQTRSCLGTPDQPHEIQINLGATYNVAGFRYLPRQDGKQAGDIAKYEFYVSNDGVNWGAPVANGTLVTDPADSTEKQVTFVMPISGKFVRLRSLSEVNGGKTTSIAELNVLQ